MSVWYGVVLYDVMWCSVLCYGVVCDVNIVVLIDVVDEVWCDGMVWYGMV